MPTTSTRRPHRPQRSNPKKKKNKSKRQAAAVVDVDELIARADAAAVASERDVAAGLYGAAAEALRASSDARLASVLARRGETRAASGDAEGAREDLREALSASEGDDDSVAARAWFHLGQTCEGEEALEAYERGAAALEARLERARNADATANDETESTETRRQLRSARCSVAELWLTDLCSAPGAEAACEAALAAATVVDRDLDDGDPEVPQTLANLRLSQADRPDRVREAADAAAESYARVEAGCVALARLVGLGPEDDDPGAAELGEEEEEVVAALPGYEFRVQTAKLLLECAAELRANDDDAATREFAAFADRAVRVLGSLLAENDEIVEPWFLLGCAFEALDDESSRAAAAHYWERARDMLRAVAKGLEDETTTTTEDDAEDLRRELEEVTARASEVEERLRHLNDLFSNTTTTTTTTNVTEMEDDRMEE